THGAMFPEYLLKGTRVVAPNLPPYWENIAGGAVAAAAIAVVMGHLWEIYRLNSSQHFATTGGVHKFHKDVIQSRVRITISHAVHFPHVERLFVLTNASPTPLSQFYASDPAWFLTLVYAPTVLESVMIYQIADMSIPELVYSGTEHIISFDQLHSR
ncbi:hypothetical protein BDK51DRAFT_25769, partial [Blyttiomyces helicus]